jgi:hypothetical protein
MKSNVVKAMAKIVALTSNKANPIIINSLMHIWQVINASQLLNFFPKCLKLVKITLVHVVDFVEDKHCFYSIVYYVHNCLNLHWRLVCIIMCAQILFTYDKLCMSTYLPRWLVVQYSSTTKNQGKGKEYTNLQTFIINICATKNYARYILLHLFSSNS